MTVAPLHPDALRSGEGPFVFYDPQSFPIWLNLALFAVSGVAIWFAGTRLAKYADTISERTGLGQAFVGILLLAVATSLPEVASIVTTSLIGAAPLAVNNLLGAVVVQTSLLAVADRVGGRQALTHFSARAVLLLEGLLVVGLLTIALIGLSLGDVRIPIGIGIGVWPLLIFVVYLLGLYLVKQYRRTESWAPTDDGSEQQGKQGGDSASEEYEGWSNRKLYLAFAGGAAVILVAGTILGRTGDALASQTGLGRNFVGVTLLAVATALPEISTTVSAARIGAYSMAVSNIFGSTMLLPALLFVADIFYSGAPIVDAVGQSSILGAGVGILVTVVYLLGLVERRDRTLWGFGIDSIAVIVIFILSIGGQYLVR